MNLQIAATTWVNDDGSGRWKRVHFDLVTLEEQLFDTLVTDADLINETNGTFELVIQGNMKDENGTQIPIPQTRRSYKEFVIERVLKEADEARRRARAR